MERTTVNAYLFTEPDPILIDTGDASPEGWAALTAGLGTLGLAPQDLTQIIISHMHVDHFGQVARLASLTDARFRVIDAGYRWLTDFRTVWTDRLEYYRTTFLPGLGMPAPQREQIERYSAWVLEHYDGVPAARAEPLREGERIDMGTAAWQTLYTPGHAGSQCCFYQADARLLLASDMLLRRTPTPVIEPPQDNALRVPALPQFVTSLQRLAAMEIGLVYPGHGQPFDDARAVIQRQLARIEMRKNECLEHIHNGAHTVYQIHERMYPPAAFVNMAGLWMVVGYLDMLQEENRVGVEVRDGCWWYAACEA
jgi:glyoxylase-like metal-dependent hydrolase (beta-lactamase superfamily II)